eukprot:TRINITY_DN76370_c0_g1_i1.p1 TRINITY_DN76370_c0_g1~~TRINITY_DN76370_c0_g1_i1.p1  ORF type:complete len:167 (-),score=45.43 TRINITY_DN76370_c0_g1_i1:142-642(-)
MPAEQPKQPWWVWLSLWSGTVVSVFSIILYILVLDVDIPAMKPRPARENLAACLVYISHSINIISSALAAFALLQQEYAVVLCWAVWCGIHTMVMVVLTVLSFFTLLRSIPTRVILHVISALLSIWSIFVMLRRQRTRTKHNWSTKEKEPMGETNKLDMSRESNML